MRVNGEVTGYDSIDHGGLPEERAKLVSVDQWGATGFTSLRGAFARATNLTGLPTDPAGTAGVTVTADMFSDAQSLVSVPDLDTSNVRIMVAMFRGASSLTSVPTFDTSNVTNMDQMFDGATAFNADLSGWCVPGIADEPFGFASGTPAGSPYLPPVWGTCPS